MSAASALDDRDRVEHRRVGREKRPIAVIGGGFSGTMAAIQLSRHAPGDRPILLCERGPAFGIGVAYATQIPSHLLNVRASNMSAYAADPTHFEAWLEREGEPAGAEACETEAGVFASRNTYGKYLKSILYDAVCGSDNTGQLRLLPDEIVDCRRIEGGFELTSASGRRYSAGAVVLATGHVPPTSSPDERYVTNPWAPGATSGLDDGAPVLVLGTGLTMVDVVLALRQGGFAGPVVALSRRGALSQPHRTVQHWPRPEFTATERRSVRLTMHRLRAEVAAARLQGVDWRAVVDSIRPITAELWQGWPEAERRRFLRHARRWWDIHRHRMAPPNAAAIDAARGDGSLRIVAGRVRGIAFDADTARVTYEPRAGGTATLAVQRVIVATGLESALQTTDRLTQRLIEQGLARLDGLGFGIDVTTDLQVVGADGHPVDKLWALGPIVRGVFWECIAVPDIRQQAERFGRHAARALAEI
jgi:uncharacterized NAD(P)/FAD-binding protein YdhS